MLVCYPAYSEEEYSLRTKEIRSLGIHSLFVVGGRSTINGISICGKGCVGLVLQARTERDQLALKIRRTDADRASMENEAILQQIANGAGVGPQYMAHTKNLLAMEYIEGRTIIEWIENASADQFRKVAKAVLEQCFALDKVGLDHGELSRLGRHVIVSSNDTPYIIDFESASMQRKTINVSSAAQSLFLYGIVAARAKKIVPQVDRDMAVACLQRYKRVRDRDSFEKLLDFLAI